jgi:cystathionine beta-lyase/cystathionine gamma-synthase
MAEKKSKPWGIDTQCVHCGEATDPDTQAIRRPIHMANSYEMPTDIEELLKVFSWDHPDKFQYTREHSASPRYLEERLTVLEGSEECVVAASGMGAISATLFTLLKAGDHVVAPEVCYSASQEMFSKHLPRFGVKVSLVDSTDNAEVEAAITKKTKVVYIETPGNPLVSISDIKSIARIAHTNDALCVVDSTWSGLVTQRPLELGADVVIHSATKYLNGHGDALGGAVMGQKEFINSVRESGIVHLGACISPFNAWLIMRGLVTLPLRMRKHSENGMKVAQFLESHDKVDFVRYPGLQSHPQHSIAKKQMNGFSGMIVFRQNLELLKNFDFLSHLKMIKHAVSVGHDQSLIYYLPTLFFFADMVVLNERQQQKYTDLMGEGVYRLSVGIEHSDDIIYDLSQAMDSLAMGRSLK